MINCRILLLFCVLFIASFFNGIRAQNAQLPDVKKYVLERVSVDRIKKHALTFQKQLRNARWYRRLFYGASGVACVGLGWWLWHWKEGNAQQVVPTTHEVSGGQGLSDAESRQLLAALGQRMFEEYHQRFRLVNVLKRSASNGLQIALYSFIGGLLFSSFSSAWEKINKQHLNLWGNGAVDQAKASEQAAQALMQSLCAALDEYAQISQHHLETDGGNEISASYLALLEKDLVSNYASFIYSFEELIAFLSELQIEHCGKNEQKIALFDENVKNFYDVLTSFMVYLDLLLNMPLGQEKISFCAKVDMSCKQVYRQLVKFLHMSSVLVFG